MSKNKNRLDNHPYDDEPSLSKKNKVIRSLSGTIGSRLLSQVVSMGTTMFLARMLFAKDFGLMAMCMIYIDLLNNVIDAGFLQAIIQKKEVDQRLLSSCFWFLIIIVLFCYALTVVLSPLVALCFRESALIPLIRSISIVILFSPVQILASAILIRELRAEYVGLAEFLGLFFKTIVVVFLAYQGYGVWSLVIGFIAMRFIVMIVSSYYSMWLPSLAFDGENVKETLSFGLKVTGSKILWYLYSRVDNIIIGGLIGAEALGLYSVSLQIINKTLNLFSMVYQRVAFPIFSKYQNDIDELRTIFLKFVFVASLISFPTMFGISAASNDLIIVLFGSKWASASWLLSVLSCVAPLRLIGTLSPVAMNSIGKPGLSLYFNFVNLIVMSVFLSIGTSIWALNGVVWTWVFVYPVFFLSVQKVCTHQLQLSLNAYLKNLAGPFLLGFAIMAFAFLVIRWTSMESVHFRLFLLIIVCSTVYLAVVYLIFKQKLTEILSFVGSI